MDRSILLERHERAGARLGGPDPQRPAPLTFGDVPAEYAAGVEGCALFDQSDRGLVVASGGERAEFLHRLLANDVRGLAPGRTNRNLLLSSKGKVLFDVDVAVDAERIELSTIPGTAAALLAALELYHFTEDVELADATAEHAPLALCGPKASAVLRTVLGASALPAGEGGWARVTFDDAPAQVASVLVAGSVGWRVAPLPQSVAKLWDALVVAGATPAGLVAQDSLRVEACSAAPGVDVGDTVYPQEARLEPAFSLSKGCYIGQEVVAKIDTYGGLNKCLVPLRVEHDDPVPPGTRLVREDDGEWRDLGVVTSWAYSFALDTGVVLAYVKRRHQAVGTEFRLGAAGAARATVVQPPLRTGALAPTGSFE